MRTLTKKPMVRCYQVLHEADGLTAGDLTARCNQRYGLHGKEYWNRQLQALAEMGCAQKSGRWLRCAPVWVAVADDEQQ